MAKPTISEVLDRLSQSEQRNAAMFASIFEGMTTLAEAVKPKADQKVLTTAEQEAEEMFGTDEENGLKPKVTETLEFDGPTEAELAQQTEKNTVNGKIKRLAFHKEGLLLEGNSKWFNAPKGSRLFEKLSTGTVVTLSIEGDWVKTYSLDGTVEAPKEVVRTESKSTEGGCEFCKGSAHRHVSTVAVQIECLNRQVQTAGGAPVNFKDLGTVDSLLEWMNVNVPKFAGMGAAPAASAPQIETPKEQGQQRRRFNGRRNGAPKEKELEANVTGGTYKGFINRIGQTPETAHMVRIVSDIHQGPKGEGVWFSASKELLAGRSVGDRVSFVLDGRDKNLGKLIGLTLLGSVEKDTGHKAGVENSGKQQAPAPKGQPKDEVVAAGKDGAAAKAAKVQERRSRMAAANKGTAAA